MMLVLAAIDIVILEMSINVQSKFTQNSETALILQPA